MKPKKPQFTWIRNVRIILRQKLVRPMVCSTNPPEVKARGVAVGMAWAMTPLVGVQMACVGFTWGVAKYFKWRFSLPLALAWTWVTNVITLAPIYYVFYVTGQIFRGHWDNISGFQSLKNIIENVFLSEMCFMEQTKEFLALFLKDWGVSMFIGCVPWVIIASYFSYKITLRFEEKLQQRRLKSGKV